MPRDAITVNTIARLSGDNELTKIAAVSANGASMANDGRTVLLVENYDVAIRTVTIVSVADPVTGRLGDISLAVPAAVGGVAGTAMSNFLPPHLFNQSTGVVNINIDGATTVKFSAIDLAPYNA